MGKKKKTELCVLRMPELPFVDNNKSCEDSFSLLVFGSGPTLRSCFSFWQIWVTLNKMSEHHRVIAPCQFTH